MLVPPCAPLRPEPPPARGCGAGVATTAFAPARAGSGTSPARSPSHPPPLPMRFRRLVALLPLVWLPAAVTPGVRSPSPDGVPALDSLLRRGYHWRNLGPDRGGRSIAVSGVRGRPREAYFGAVGGGLWKTTDAGEHWRPVTDGQITSASVGAVAVSESNPDVLYIGTGESCIRGNILPGDGIYRSSDGGRSWTHVGFRSADAISKIRVDPTNPDIVYAAVFGRYSAPSAERGVYRSTDGGRSWRRVLFRDDRTAAIDLAIDRTNPKVLYAALWEASRTEWNMSSGGPGSGLFRSTDGGESWTEITRAPGLPTGVDGRIGVAVSAANPRRVYALVENDRGGLFRSDDAGSTWTLVNDSRAIRQRAFYYTHVFADPADADIVYLQNTSMFRSTDGGKTTTAIDNGTHGDFHDLWIDPDAPAHLVVGNDGGGAVSPNSGARWSAQNFPTGQFYHVATTAHIPYHVCGAQQDNSTLCIPVDWNAAAFARLHAPRRRGDSTASAPDSGDVTAGGMQHAYAVGGGEPGYIAPDPRQPDVFFSGTNNGGYLDRYDRRTGHAREVNPYPWFYSGEPSSALRERWQWTYPIVFSPRDSTTLYVSSQRLWRTRDGGRSWQALSGDLTRHDPRTMGLSGGPITGDMNGPEVYGTIFSVGPGRAASDVVWTGSDDGLVHVTRDGGRTWTNVTPPQLPPFGRVSQIEASAFDPAAAYVSVRRPLLDDRAPYIFATADYGRHWRPITSGIRSDAYVNAVREDPWRRGLLYAGTQHGVYLSYDDGAHWESLALDMPDLPIVDLVVKESELVVASHGRGFWVLDALGALRQASPEILTEDVHLFVPAGGVRSGAGVTISWLTRRAPASLTLEILDSAGAVLRTVVPDTTRADSTRRSEGRRRDGAVYLPTTAGLNSIVWDLRTQGITPFSKMILWGANTNGPAVPPGRYLVRLTADGRVRTAPVSVRRNPLLVDVSDADLRAQYAFGTRVRDRASQANQAVIDIRRLTAQLDERLARAPADTTLRTRASALRDALSAVEERIYQVRNQSGQDPLNFPIRVNNRLATLLSMSERGDGRPTSNMPVIFEILSTELQGYLDRLQTIRRTELAATNAELVRLGAAPLVWGSVETAAPAPPATTPSPHHGRVGTRTGRMR